MFLKFDRYLLPSELLNSTLAVYPEISMPSRILRIAGILIAAALVTGLLDLKTSEAREGFSLGYGFAGQTAKGDLDGSTVYTDSTGNQYLIGSLNSGTGSALVVGYGFNRFIGLELMSVGTIHSASHTQATDTDAILAAGLLGFRFTAPVAKSFELFLRVGSTGYSAEYKDYVKVAPALTQTTTETLTGSGSAYGAGFEILGDHLGLEFGYLVHSATFTQAKASGQANTFDLPHHLSVPITTTSLIVNYHFK